MLRHGSHSFTCKLPHACLFCKHSPDAASTEYGSEHLITAHYSFNNPKRMKGWVGLVSWPIADGLAAYPHKWSPLSYRSRAGRRKNAGQRLTFYCWATQVRHTCADDAYLRRWELGTDALHTFIHLCSSLSSCKMRRIKTFFYFSFWHEVTLRENQISKLTV